MPDSHSKFSPSAAGRWLACPGSLNYDEGGENRSSEYAAEGTVAHALAQRCWLLGCEASVFIGQPRSCDGFTITITEEMAVAVQIYLDYIATTASQFSNVWTETRLIHSAAPEFGGTLDCLVFGGTDLHVIDFKYGAGVAVDAERNDQLACYALLVCDHFKIYSLASVKLTVIQPRANHQEGPIRSWVASQEYLVDFAERVFAVIAGNRADELNAGDHCRWCPLKVNCPELHDLTLKYAADEFLADKMTPAKAAEILTKRTAIRGYLDAIESWVHGQLDKGEEIPGYKLVNAYGNRRYSATEDQIVRRCKNHGFGKKQIYKSELLSPAQLEKLIGKDLVSSLVERPHTGTTVVPAYDKREPVTRQTASDEFSGVEYLL